MKQNFPALTLKLIQGIRHKYGQVLLYATEQKISEKTGNVYTEYRLYLNITVAEYNEMFPNNLINPYIHKSKYVKLLLKKTISNRELFLFLLKEIWEKLESGEAFAITGAKVIKY